MQSLSYLYLIEGVITSVDTPRNDKKKQCKFRTGGLDGAFKVCYYAIVADEPFRIYCAKVLLGGPCFAK